MLLRITQHKHCTDEHLWSLIRYLFYLCVVVSRNETFFSAALTSPLNYDRASHLYTLYFVGSTHNVSCCIKLFFLFHLFTYLIGNTNSMEEISGIAYRWRTKWNEIKILCVHWECSLLSNESPYFEDATNKKKILLHDVRETQIHIKP